MRDDFNGLKRTGFLSESHLFAFNTLRITLVNVYVDLCKHLGINSSTDLDDQYSNLFLNAYINCCAHTEYLKMI